MGGGSTDTNSTTQSQQVTQLPPWINTAAQQNYGFAQNVAAQPLQQYQGQMVAGIAPQTQQAWNTAASGGNAGAPQYNAAQAAYQGVLGQQPMSVAPSGTVNPSMVRPGTVTAQQVTDPGNAMSVSAGQLSNTNLQPYMNPYTQDVINATLPIMQQNLGLSQDQQQNAANSANAFGGSRQAIQQGVTQAQGAMGMGQMAAQLNQANFAQAQQGAEFDIGSQLQASLANQASQQTDLARNLQAQLANQGTNLTGQLANQSTGLQGQLANQAAGMNAQEYNIGTGMQAQLANQAAQQNQGGLNLQAAGGLSNLGAQAQQSQLRNFGEQTTAGSLEQQQAQNEINANMANFQQAWQYPYMQLGTLQSALGMTPYGNATQGQSNTQTQTQTSPNYLQAATSGLQMLGSLPLGGLFTGSDRKMKTDIAKVGDHPSGVPLYSFRYKGDPKSYPKVVGPLAEEVAKIAPHAVAKIPGSGGKMAVNMAAVGRRPMPSVPAFGPRGGAGPVGSPPPGFNMGPVVPGALSGPGVSGGIGALGSTMRRPSVRRPHPPPLRGAARG
jgi:hypothetical protein